MAKPTNKQLQSWVDELSRDVNTVTSENITNRTTIQVLKEEIAGHKIHLDQNKIYHDGYKEAVRDMIIWGHLSQ